MQYKVPQHIDNNKVFLVNFSEINGRLDPQFYKEHFNFENFNKLSYVAKVNGGKRIPLGENYSNEKTDYLYLRVADINNEGIVNFATLKYISYDLYEVLKRYEIYNGDVAISIAGTIGKIVYINGIPQNKHVILTENCAKFKLINDNILAEYLKIVLELPIVQKQIKLNYIQTTIPKLGLDKIYSLMLPPFPDKEKQQNIINHFNAGRLKKFQKEQEAADKLNSIDDYLLRELGITMPSVQTQTLEDRTFIVYFSDVIGKRFDPNGVSLFMYQPKSSKYESIQLSQIAKIEKGEAITKDQVNTLGKYPVIAGGQTSPYNNDTFNYDGDVITVSASGSAGYVWYHDYPIFASDCSVIYSKDKYFSTKYIFEVLKAEQDFIYRLKQGAIQPHVYPNDLANLLIPNIELSKQQEIVEHISQLRTEAKRLQKEGAEILRKAKEDIEKMIIE